MPTSNATSIFMTDKTLESRIRTTGAGNFSAGVGFIARYYYLTLEANRPPISSKQALFIAKALKGFVVKMEDLNMLKMNICQRLYDTASSCAEFESLANETVEMVTELGETASFSLIDSAWHYSATKNNGINNPKMQLYFNIGDNKE